jgi:amino acid adenylation domain-containing protein
MRRITKSDIEDIVGLTPVQEGMLFHYLRNPGSSHYFEQLCLDISGTIHFERFKQAWLTVIKTNEMLRTVYRWDEVPEPVQVILKDYPFHPGFYDFSENNSVETQEHVEEIKRKDRQQKFDLWEVPFRVTLCKTAESGYKMIISHHHILCDGWSNGIILQEFLEAYRILSRHKTPAKITKTRFKEYVRWLGNRDKKEQETFWRNYLKGFAGSTGLPRQKRTENGYEVSGCDNYSLKVEKEFTAQLEAFSRERKITLASVFYGTWGLILQVYGNSGDVVFGTTVSGRSAKVAGIESIVGLFINTIPVRVRASSETSVASLLTGIDEFLLTREPFESTSLTDIKEWCGTANGIPLFDSILVMENYPLGGCVMKGDEEFTFQGYDGFHMTNYALNLGIMLTDEMHIHFVYDPHLFNPSTIRVLGAQFLHVIREMTKHPELKLSEIDILPQEEKNRILQELNHNVQEDRLGIGQETTLAELFTEQVSKTPGHVAITGTETGSMTYGEVNEKSDRLARLLRKKGVEPGTIVGIMLEPCLDMIIAILAVLKAGGAYMPIDPAYPPERVKFMLEDADTGLLLTDSGVLESHSYTLLQGIEPGQNVCRTTQRRGQITRLDEWPPVDRSGVEYEKYQPRIGHAMVKNTFSIQATRGCPYNCAYCHKIWPKKHVFRSAEHLFDEVQRCYRLGVSRYAFIDDIFNLNIENSRRFFQLVIDHGLDVQFFFPNGLRGDLLTPDYIDLMVKAGTVSFALALETASPRLQKFIGKNLDLEKIRGNLEYTCRNYPHVILELFAMHGFPSETEEEALNTLEFIKSLHWLHFPYIHILKIYPGTDMAELAHSSGIDARSISRSAHLGYHQLPETLPFDSQFTHKYQGDFLNRYFLSKERLLHVLPYQMRILTEDEMVQKYNSYLPAEIKSLRDLLDLADIDKRELETDTPWPVGSMHLPVPDLDRRIREAFPREEPFEDGFGILLLDLSQFFSSDKKDMLYDMSEPPLGLMYLSTALVRRFGKKVRVKIAKSRVDFDSYSELKELIEKFKPGLIGIRTLTYYKNFFHQAVSLLRQWRSDVPIVAGGPYATSDYASLLKDRHIDLVVLGEGELTLCEIIAVLMANGGKLPTEEQLEHIAGIAYVPDKKNTIHACARDILLMDFLPEVEKTVGDAALLNRPEDPAYVIYTSGTTGKPKGTLVEHRNITGLMAVGKGLFDYDSRDVWTMYHSYCFDFSVWEMYGALLHGGRLVLVTHMLARDPAGFLQLLKKECATIMNQTPAVFYLLADHETGIEGRELHVRIVIFGGEALKPGKLAAWEKKYPDTRLINMYGITETTVHVTFKEITLREIESDISNIGKPISSLSCYILENHLRVLPQGAIGELFVAGQGVSRGYLNRPELTAERFINSPFAPGNSERLYRSGDLVRLNEKGEMEYLGRTDHQVKIRGNRVELAEVERQMLRLDRVDEAVVTAHESETGNRYLAAYLKIIPGGELTVSVFREALLARVPEYMVPSYFIPLETFPLTATGKVDRARLPLPGGSRPGLGAAYAAPETSAARKIATVWQDILKVDRVGIHDNFFEVGGNSLNIIKVKSRLQQALEREIQVADLFEYPTIEALTQYLGLERQNATTSKNNIADFTDKLARGRAKMKGRSQMVRLK